MSHVRLLTLLFILCALNQATSVVYYITSINTNHVCTTQQCLTLSQFAASLSSHSLHSNTTLVFLPGIHHLSQIDLTFSNVGNFVMKSENSTAQIKCANALRMHFSHSQSIRITSLKFIGCGGNQVRRVEEFVIEDTSFKGQENTGTALELIETTAQIVNCTFVSNRMGTYREDGLIGGAIGGAIIAITSTVDISRSIFEDNGAEYGGAVFAEQYSIINMSGNVFVSNSATFGWGLGGVLYSINSIITIEATDFHNNSASWKGGVLFSNNNTITIKASEFHSNSVPNDGGVVCSYTSSITIEASIFHNNYAYYRGGVLASNSDNITIKASEFYDNIATFDGGVLDSWYSSTITIEESEFYGNSAANGGVLHSNFNSTIAIEASEFHDNMATKLGGVLHSAFSTIITKDGSNFANNFSPIGAIIYATSRSVIQHKEGFLVIDSNRAVKYAVVYLSDSQFIGSDSATIFWTDNLGSLMAFNSNFTFTGYATFVNNQPSQTGSGNFQEGGAITLFQSNVYFDGVCNLEQNHATYGGAIHSTESKLYVNGNMTIAHNTASRNGGGVYLSTSELNCQQESTFVLWNNTATHNGGGIHAMSSAIKAASSSVLPDSNSESGYHYAYRYTGARINITRNAAERGGGLSLEGNAKFYILKYNYLDLLLDAYDTNTTIFTANHAEYGAAVYIDDDTNSAACASNTNSECFCQVLAVYGDVSESSDIIIQSMHFSQNFANISGSTLYGGLLDRCAMSPYAEMHKKYQYHDFKDKGDGIAYFKNMSTLRDGADHNSIIHTESNTRRSVSSDPVRVCFCSSDQNEDCSHQSYTEVKRGQTFTHSVVAVDQIGQPVNAIIQASLLFTESGLAEGQLTSEIPAECTNLIFTVVSPHDSESLFLYALDGPCKDAELSTATIEVHFLPCSCPIGLQVSGTNNTNCKCVCHSHISRYVEHCDGHTGSIVKEPQSRAWISYTKNANLSGYLVYPNCPFDYCLPTSPPVDLNQPNGADAQCAFDRSSLLCGSCRPGLSLSLGSSRCLQCPSYWPARLIATTTAAILAGIALVSLLLILNMTVAVGTLNGLIFYANVVYANKTILLPFQKTNFITVFISWLNLDPGIDTCYFPGMDTYIKTF